MKLTTLLKRFIKPTRQPGNSLTFLLTTSTVFCVSLSVTTMALGPMAKRSGVASFQSIAVNQVADHYLDRLEAYIKQNPDEFAEETNWDPAIINNPDDGLPPYQVFKPLPAGTTYATFLGTSPGCPPSVGLARYCESIKVQTTEAGSEVDVEGEINDPSPLIPPDSGIIRFASATHRNNIRIRVEVGIRDGAKTPHTRTLALSADGCNVANGPITADEADVIPPVVGVEDGDFQIEDTSFPFMEVGNHRICEIPSNSALLPSTLDCYDWVAGGIRTGHPQELLKGSKDSYKPMAASPDPLQNRSFFGVADNGSKRLFLKSNTTIATVGQGVASTAISDIATTPGAGLDNVAFEDLDKYIKIDFFTPDPSASIINQKFRAALFFQDGLDVKFAVANWRVPASVVDTSATGGIFRNVGGPDIPVPDIFGAAVDINRIAYHTSSHSLVALSNTKKQIFIKKVDPPVSAIAMPTLNPSLQESIAMGDASNPLNPANILESAEFVEFGAPVFSKNMEFVVVPVAIDSVVDLIDTKDKVAVMAFNTKAATDDNYKIDKNNKLRRFSTVPLAELSNFAPIMVFDKTSALLPNDTQGRKLDDVDDIKIQYQPETRKFYWVTKNNVESAQVVYEWDPASWGAGNNIAQDWFPGPSSGTSVYRFLRNIRMAGTAPTAAIPKHTGMYYTVRKIGPEPASSPVDLWNNTATEIQMIFNPRFNEFYLHNVGIPSPLDFHRVNLVRGYKANMFSETPGLPAVEFAEGKHIMAMDSRTGWLYFPSAGIAPGVQGYWAYNPVTRRVVQLSQGGLLTSGIFTYPFGGDGNILFVEGAKQPFILDVPETFPAARPTLKRYNPYCFTNMDPTAVSGNIPGFTAEGKDFAEDNTDDN